MTIEEMANHVAAALEENAPNDVVVGEDERAVIAETLRAILGDSKEQT